MASTTKIRPLSSVLAQFPGKWVAVYRATGEPAAVADSAQELVTHLRENNIRNICIVRAPHPNEPQLVGLG